MVSVFAGKDEYLIKLDGDNTRLASSTSTEVGNDKRVIDKINALRIARATAAR
jgi:hypothetical protein